MGNLRNCKTARKRTPSTKGPAKKRTRKPKRTALCLTGNETETNVTINESTQTGHNQDENSFDNYRDFFRLLQLFPHLHPTAIESIFLACNRELLRTIDNLLWVKQYAYVLHTQVNGPATSTPYSGHQPQHNYAADNYSHCTNYRVERTDLFHDYDDHYVPNGTMNGIREQIRAYEQEHSNADML